MDHVEKAIHNLANAFCDVRPPNYIIYKASLESLVRLALSQQLADMERANQQAMAALKD